MLTRWSKVEILIESEKVFLDLTAFCLTIPDPVFFRQPNEKWSIAQNVHHLITSTKTSTAAYALPLFLVRLIGGKPNRPSRSYEESVSRYKEKLAAGAKARGRYAPGQIKTSVGKERVLANWSHTTGLYLQAIKKNRTDQQLDRYIVPHPILGKITLRELCYFNIYHTIHHLDIIGMRSITEN